jgi:flagellar hook-basal body complex protein FliE
MAIEALSAISQVFAAGATGATTATAPVANADTGFGDMLTSALDNLSSAHAEVDALGVQAATGDLTAVHDYTIASTEAQLLTQLTVEVRNRAVEAFNEIMRMQV